jgi:glycosyltransferase involved in cell wall biosynthesis
MAASGEYVAFLDADDEWLPGKLTAQVAILESDRSVTLCGCQAIWVDEDGNVIGPLFRGLPARLPQGWKRLLWQCYVATPCAVVRKDDLGIRPFDPNLRIGEDRDLWIKLATNGTVALVPEELVRIRLSHGSFMQTNTGLIRTCTRPMIEKHLRAFSDHLSMRDRLLARGSLHSQIGKILCGDPAQFWAGCGYLLASAAMGYRPTDALRELFYRAPVVRDAKNFLKRRYLRA